MAERPEDLRAADADRQFVAQRLQEALNEGRLSLSEYDDRLKDAYAAKTYGDLDKILDDLPGVAQQHQSQVVPAAPLSPAVQEPPPVAAPVGHRVAPWLTGVWTAWLIAVSVNVVIWLLVCLSSGELIYFWPMWVAGPWGAVLLVTSLSGVASGHGYQRRSREKLERRMARDRARWEQRHNR